MKVRVRAALTRHWIVVAALCAAVWLLGNPAGVHGFQVPPGQLVTVFIRGPFIRSLQVGQSTNLSAFIPNPPSTGDPSYRWERQAAGKWSAAGTQSNLRVVSKTPATVKFRVRVSFPSSVMFPSGLGGTSPSTTVTWTEPAGEPTGPTSTGPTPGPQPSTAIGATECAQAVADGPLRLERLDQPGAALELDIGRMSADRRDVTLGGVIRDAADGQTYAVVRREPVDLDGAVVRRWVPPDSPLVYQIVWADVIAIYTVPTCVLAAIPLDGLPTVAGQAVRSHDPADPRIFRWDGETHQWRHVPDPATFQALGLYWCDVTAADPDFFTRLPDALLGPPYPSSTEPARADYPICRTA